MIIDCHVHFSDRDGFADELAEEYDRLGVVKACVLGGRWVNGKIEGKIIDAMKKYADLYLGFGYLRLVVRRLYRDDFLPTWKKLDRWLQRELGDDG